MKQVIKLLVFLFLCILFAITGITSASNTKEKQGKKTYWKITGQLEEACSCSAACPCWFDSKPTQMSCSGGQVLFIEKGTYGKTSLNNLAVANFVQSPPDQTMMESFGKWKFSYLYIDKKATKEQRQALQEIGATVFGYSKASSNIKVRYTPINRTIEGKEHKIDVGSYGSFHGHLIEGGLGGTPKIVDPPGADPVHHEYSQGKTSKLSYADAQQEWNYRNSNYMFGTFTVDSDQYEKYAAGLAQKMEAMKKEEESEK